MKPATLKKLFCNPEYKKKKTENEALPLKEELAFNNKTMTFALIRKWNISREGVFVV